MTTIAVATLKYAEHVPCFLSKSLALALSFMSSTMVCILFVSTLLHAFVWRTLFPNDLAIAITDKRQGKDGKRPFRKTYDIRRWTKQAPISFGSNKNKHSSSRKNSDGEHEDEH